MLKLDKESREEYKLQQIRTLLDEVKDVLFVDQKNFISTLKSSIIGLEESDENSSQIMIEKYRETINTKVDELEKICLEKLDNIYTRRYVLTNSYLYLKKVTDRYKDINLNMNMMGLSLIVDY